MLNYKLAAIYLMLALLAGCASNTVPDPEPTDTTYDAAGSGADTDVYGDDPMGGGEALEDDEGTEDQGPEQDRVAKGRDEPHVSDAHGHDAEQVSNEEKAG